MNKSKGRAISPGYAAVYLILILWSLTTIFPLAWSVMNSFKDKKMIYSNSFALPLGEAFSLGTTVTSSRATTSSGLTGTASSSPAR